MRDDAFTTTVPVRYRDLDTWGHVNNAVYATYLEEARVAYFAAVVGADLEDADAVLASLSVEFERSIRHGESVVVACAVPELGSASVPMDYEIRADGEVVATAESVQVHVDRETRASRPLPESWRERIAAHEELSTGDAG